MKQLLRVFFLAIALFLTACAKRGTPTGGAKDSIPPVLINASPKQNTIFFDAEKITLTFDEYIKLNNISKQLIISPPLPSKAYKVDPQTNIAKKIEIELLDSLNPNTTYTFNFGESITDNNEGNILPFFSYTLSTGATIDSLYVRGRVTDAFDEVTTSYISVQLYPVDSVYKDSTIYKQQPLYVASTLDSTIYRFQNLKAGTYEIIAIKDVASNYFFDQNVDKIGFRKEYITLPQDSIVDLKIFKEITNFSWARPFFINRHHIGIPYYGRYENQKMEVISDLPDSFEYLINKNRETDTLNYWFKGIQTDSLKFQYLLQDSLRTTTVKFNKPIADSLVISRITGNEIMLKDTFRISSNLPLVKLDLEKITVRDIDSLPIPFRAKIEQNYDRVYIAFDLEPNNRYQIDLLPDALTDFFGSVNDTLQFVSTTQSIENYGAIFINLQYNDNTPYILELLDNKGKTVRRVTDQEGTTRIAWELLPAGKYKIRFVVDGNGNQKWDTGHYLDKIQPEEVLYFPAELDLRANWDLNETFNVAEIRRGPPETATDSVTLQEPPNPN